MLTEELSAILPGDPILLISVIQPFLAYSSAKYLGMNEACVCLDSPAITVPCSHSAHQHGLLLVPPVSHFLHWLPTES